MQPFTFTYGPRIIATATGATDLPALLPDATPPAWAFVPMPLRPESSTAIRKQRPAKAGLVPHLQNP